MVGRTAEECNFAIVQQVTIEWIDDRNVSFTTRGAGDGTADQNLRRTFTVPLSEVYTQVIHGAPPPVAMVPGATGNLYLSREGWQATTADGCYRIFGVAQAIFKYPRCGAVATPPLTRLTVLPTSIIVRGHMPDDETFYDIELSGPDAAEAQDLAWNGVSYIEVHLTSRGARRMGLGAHARSVQLWPTRIRIKGSPAIDQAVLGEVDVLDAELAACTQHIAFTRRGGQVTLVLTQDGVNAFHVTPQAAAEAACSPDPVTPAGPHAAGHGKHHRVNVTRRRSPE